MPSVPRVLRRSAESSRQGLTFRTTHHIFWVSHTIGGMGGRRMYGSFFPFRIWAQSSARCWRTRRRRTLCWLSSRRDRACWRWPSRCAHMIAFESSDRSPDAATRSRAAAASPAAREDELGPTREPARGCGVGSDALTTPRSQSCELSPRVHVRHVYERRQR